MLILGIETSCDETSAAVVEDGRRVLSNVVLSQIAAHAPFGGVVPEIASRQHVKAIAEVVQLALQGAGVERDSLDAVAATRGPGLAGSLLVGMSFARTFALALGLPFLPVNHMEGHLYSVWLQGNASGQSSPEFPVLALVVSGGHTEIVRMDDHGRYKYIGRTLDDAAGEAFDKVARLVGLEYPGGPAIQRAAEGASAPVLFPRAWLPGTYDFSFSGLKTAVLHTTYALATGKDPNELRGTRLPRVDIAHDLTSAQVSNLASGFQESIVDVLISKTARAAKACEAASVSIVGGVAANQLLRQRATSTIELPLFLVEREYSSDNAAMIASAAFFAPSSSGSLDVAPALDLVST